MDKSEADKVRTEGVPVWRSLGAALCLAGFLLGCDSYSDIRATLSPSDEARFSRGQREATACWSCHDVTGSALKVGPPLGGIMGRQVGAVPAFPYSDALRASNWVWTEENLDLFLSAPQSILPGNRMLSAPLLDSRRREDLLFFLSRVSGEGNGPNSAQP